MNIQLNQIPETRTPILFFIWCNTHNRFHHLCHDAEGRFRGGILLPCRTVDITDILEIKQNE